MNDRSAALRMAINGVLALAGSAVVSTAMAADDKTNMEQCAGIIKAGKNDCATASNDCHGHVTVNAGKDAWIYVPKGTCERLSGAHVVHVKDPTPAKQS